MNAVAAVIARDRVHNAPCPHCGAANRSATLPGAWMLFGAHVRTVHGVTRSYIDEVTR